MEKRKEKKLNFQPSLCLVTNWRGKKKRKKEKRGEISSLHFSLLAKKFLSKFLMERNSYYYIIFMLKLLTYP